MTWKTVANQHFGGPHIFGGNDIDKISNLFKGIEDVDTVDINTNWPIRDDKFKLRNPANTASYIYSTSAIAADRTITEPVMSFTSDRPVYENATQTLSNKGLSNSPLPNDLHITGVPQDLIGDPTNKRWGTYYPAPTGTTNSTVGKLTGILEGHTAHGNGSPSVLWESFGNGMYIKLATASGTSEVCGLRPPTGGTAGPFRLSNATTITVEIDHLGAINSANHFGVTSFATFPGTEGDPLISNSGILIGYANETEQNAVIRSNNGTASSATQTTEHIVGSGYRRTWRISWGTGGTNVQVDVADPSSTESFRLTTKVPSTSTDLYFHLWMKNLVAAGGASNEMHIYSLSVESN